MSAPQKDRVKASKLRAKIKSGGKLSDADRIWLKDYEAKHGAGRAQASTETPATPTKKPQPVVSGPQLAIAGTDGASGAHVHETTPESGAVDAATWIPEMPPAAEGAEAAPTDDGTTPPPKVGSPLIDDEAATPQGDPAAAQQFAALVKFFTLIGLRAGRELAESVDLPPEVRALLTSDDLNAGALDTVGAAAERVAMKYGFRSVPMADEAIVGLALVGSGVLVAKNMKRKQLEATKRPEQPPQTPGTPKRPEPEVTPLDSLWGGDR